MRLALVDAGIGLGADEIEPLQARLKVSQRICDAAAGGRSGGRAPCGSRSTWPWRGWIYRLGRQAVEDGVYLAFGGSAMPIRLPDVLLDLLAGIDGAGLSF